MLIFVSLFSIQYMQTTGCMVLQKHLLPIVFHVQEHQITEHLPFVIDLHAAFYQILLNCYSLCRRSFDHLELVSLELLGQYLEHLVCIDALCSMNLTMLLLSLHHHVILLHVNELPREELLVEVEIRVHLVELVYYPAATDLEEHFEVVHERDEDEVFVDEGDAVFEIVEDSRCIRQVLLALILVHWWHDLPDQTPRQVTYFLIRNSFDADLVYRV